MGDIDITPEGVREQGRRLAALADAVAAKSRQGRSEGNPAFRTTAAIRQLQGHFADGDRALGQRLRDLSDAVNASALSYERVEDHNAAESRGFFRQAEL